MTFREIRYSSADGLILHAREYGHIGNDPLPLLCLPGLTRNCKDFEAVVPRYAKNRRVICPDFRGRGQSQYAADPMTYRADVELADTLALLDHLGVRRVAVIGTSRGGLVAMLMAASARDRLAGAALNDIGPRIEPAGLLRIRSYLGNVPDFASWAEAVEAVKRINPGFEGLDEAAWLAFARRLFREEGGLPRADYDPNLAATFPTAEDIEAGKVPELWELFDFMIPLPALILRGANSDLLSEATVTEMSRRHPALTAVTVKGRAHVPFLDEPESLVALDRWLDAVDAREGAG